MRFVPGLGAAMVVLGACGGTTANVDGGVDGSVSDSGSKDASTVDAAECVPPGTTCATPCPPGTYCLKVSGPTAADLGCTAIPAECKGTPSCDCMVNCFCTGSAVDKCTAGQDYLLCDNGLKSRRALKKDITYVSDAERAELANETLSIPLARYRYKTEPQAQPTHLGFIIDDQPDGLPAIAADGTHVDLYGYTSMLVATVQEQQKQIDTLEREVATMREVCAK